MHSSDTKPENGHNFLLKEIFGRFKTVGSYLKGYPYGSGHIHDTFLVETDGPDDYILQRLNGNVFKNIPQMQENIERVTMHIREKLRLKNSPDINRECLTFLYSSTGKTWIIDSDGFYWRISTYIPDHRTYEIMDTPVKAVEAGKAIGKFQSMLADFKGKPLNETIPNFQNVGKRLETFSVKIKEDRAGRVSSVKDEIEFIAERAEKMKVIINLGDEGIIPLRITHNDTKFNNILLDKNDKALCLIDLDTVMPGYIHYDFGDAMRTGANIAAEDEPDLSKIKFDLGIFKAFSEGYLSEAGNILTKSEIEYLAFAPLLITYTQAVRFLTDYIDGDRYYKIHHEHHNLQRTRAQIQLVRSMEEQYSEMQGIIRSLA
jgi:Ser/Thr protein kinase RdoA (MazF antagonist)